MRHVPLLLALLVPCADALTAPTPAPIQEEKKETASERKKRLENEAKTVAKALKKKLASKDVAERRAAIVDAAETNHEIVVKAIERALSDRDTTVRRIALERLGTMSIPEARDACKDHARSAKKALRKDPETMVTLIRAVGRHADPEDIGWFLDDAFGESNRDIRRAKIFASARSRSKDAIEGMMRAMGRTDTRMLQNRFHQARVALVWLTGKDQGEDPANWTKWWRENRDDFEVPAQAPKLHGKMQAEWRTFWGERREYDRQKKRGDRG